MRIMKHLRNLLIASSIGIASGVCASNLLHAVVDNDQKVTPAQAPDIQRSDNTAYA